MIDFDFTFHEDGFTRRFVTKSLEKGEQKELNILDKYEVGYLIENKDLRG